MRLHTVNLGCKVNRVETDEAASLLLGSGFEESGLPSADVVLVNTCTVTGEAEKKTRKAVRHALRQNEFARVVVTGCATAIDADTYLSMDPRVTVVPKFELFDYLRENFATNEGFHSVLRSTDAFRTRVGVKVQDGCDNACSFCIVHVARGRATSKPVSVVCDEVAALVESGVKEIVLTGINLGSYCDLLDGQKTGLADLLTLLLEQTSHAEGTLPRFRISSIEPKNVDDALIDVMAQAEGRICRHLHLPLQSGSSKVLREMARPYDAEFFCCLVDKLRASMPSMALSTDIIAGFPGETEADFRETLEVARRSRFMKIHAFPYSKRTGTPAARRPDQIDPAIKQERASRLRQLSEELERLDYSSRVNTVEMALVEPGNRATTESYHTVDVSESYDVGQLVSYRFN